MYPFRISSSLSPRMWRLFCVTKYFFPGSGIDKTQNIHQLIIRIFAQTQCGVESEDHINIILPRAIDAPYNYQFKCF